MIPYFQQGKYFFHARQYGQFIGYNRIKPSAAQEFVEEIVYGPPVF